MDTGRSGVEQMLTKLRTTARLMEDPDAMRPHQLRRVTTHIAVCARCRLRYGAAIEPHIPERLAS